MSPEAGGRGPLNLLSGGTLSEISSQICPKPGHTVTRVGTASKGTKSRGGFLHLFFPVAQCDWNQTKQNPNASKLRSAVSVLIM